MSHFLRVSGIEFQSATSLISALHAIGFDVVEQHDKPTTLNSIFGTHSEAEIIVRKLTGATKETPGVLYYGDMGFAKGEKGYVPVLEDYDRKYCGFNDAWFGKLTQAYSKTELTKQFRDAGMTVESQQLQGGKLVKLVVQGF